MRSPTPTSRSIGSAADAHAILGGSRSGNDATRVTTIVDRRAAGTYIGRPPPLDFAEEPELAELRQLPGANLLLFDELRAGPFGDTSASLVVVDGRVTELVTGRAGEPDVELAVPFRQLMRLRRGEASMEEILEQGTITGSLEDLIFLAGLVESGPFQRASRRCSASAASLALAALGETVAQAGYREAMAGVMSGSDSLATTGA